MVLTWSDMTASPPAIGSKRLRKAFRHSVCQVTERETDLLNLPILQDSREEVMAAGGRERRERGRSAPVKVTWAALRPRSGLFEVDPLVDGEARQVAAEAVQPHLDRPQSHPLAPADDAAAAGRDVLVGGDRQADGAAELDAVGALAVNDQDGQRVGRGRLAAERLRDRLGGPGRDLARGWRALEPGRSAHLVQIAGHDAAAEDLLRPGEVGGAGGDLPSREGLHYRPRAPPAAQLAQDDTLERLIVLSEDEVAEPGSHLALHGLELPADVLLVGPAHGQLGLELRIVGTEPELHAPVGHERFDARQEGVDVRLAEAVGVKALQVDDGLQAALCQEAGDDLLLEHAPELARHARREEEPGLADVEREAAGRADRVVDHLRGDRQHGLLPVVRRHYAAAPAKEVLHAGQPLLVQRQLDAGRLRRDLLGQVVDRGAEAAVDDDRVRSLRRQLERPQQALAVVADRRLPPDREADVLQPLAHVAEVGVDDLSGQDLVARADDLESHGRARVSPAAASRARRRAAWTRACARAGCARRRSSRRTASCSRGTRAAPAGVL